MTAQKLFSEKTLDRRLLGNLLRRRAVHSLVAFLAVFFSLAVPLMLFGGLDAYERTLTTAEQTARFIEILDGIFAVYTFAVGVLGVYFGAITMRYMMERRSAVFYHALPQKRHTLLLTSIVAALISMLVGALIGLFVAFCVMAAHGMLLSAVCLAAWTHLWKNAIFFLVIYALTVFMGSFSGGSLVQVLCTLVSLGYLPLMIVMLLGAHDMNASHFYMEYYLGGKPFAWTSPVLWLFHAYEENAPVWQYLIWVVIALAFLVCAFLIYDRRKIENTGKSVAFPKVGSLIKYLLMAAAALVGDLFFCLFNENYAIFGLAWGIFLSFIICNTILEKSPKGMFKGVKGVIVFAIAALAFFFVWQADLFRIDDYLPRAERISYAEIQLEDMELSDKRVYDRATIAALMDALDTGKDGDNYDLPYPRISIRVVLHQKFGPPLARRYALARGTGGADAFLSAYADAVDLNAPLCEFAARVRAYGDTYADMEICFGDRNWNWIGDFPLNAFLEIYERELGRLDAARVSAPADGYFSVNALYGRRVDGGHDYYSMYGLYKGMYAFPIYADMKASRAYLDAFIDRKTESDGDAGMPAFATIYRTNPPLAYPAEYPSATLSAEEAAALSPYLADLDRTPYALRAFVDVDTDYYVIITYADPEMKGEDMFSDMPIKTDDVRTYYFLKNRVPAQVSDRFK